MTPSEIAFLAVGLIVGAAIGAAIAEALRARPAPRRRIRVTIAPNTVSPRRSRTLADAAPGDMAADGAAAVPSPHVPDRAADPIPGAGALPLPEVTPGAPTRTPVPTVASDAAAPASPSVAPGAVPVPVAPSPGVAVGPGSPSRDAAPAFMGAPRDAGPPAPGAVHESPPRGPGATGRASSAAVGVLEPALEAAPGARAGTVVVARPTGAPRATPSPTLPTGTPVGHPAGLPATLDVGPSPASLRVRLRSTRADARPSLGAGLVAVPVGRVPPAPARAELDDPGPSTPPASPAASASIDPIAADPCETPRRLVEERCALASAARENAKAAAEALRDAQRRYDTLREHADRAEKVADPREIAISKDELHAAFRAANDAASTAEEAEAAARGWLDAINEVNRRAREATRFVETAAAELRAALPRIERLALDADAARISAEAADAGCQDARERLAACDEAATRAPAPVPPAGGAPETEPHPFDALWPGESEHTRTQPLTGPEPADELAEGGLPVVIRVLQGDRAARDRLVASLAGTDADAARTWGLRLSALFDAIGARAIEDGYLDLPADDAFWGLFSFAERREIVAALAALGFRYDGLRGFADGRIPASRDLSLAIGYAGLDRMRIRTWQGGDATGSLFERAAVAADEWLADRADDLSLGQMVEALGPRAGDFADIWNAWGRVRPALLAGD